jgi:hypothetical protein
MSANLNVLSKITAAETALVGAIHTAADRLDALATDAVESALSRLRHSAAACQARLEAAVDLSAIVGTIVEAFALESGAIVLALEHQEQKPPANESRTHRRPARPRRSPRRPGSRLKARSPATPQAMRFPKPP